MDGNGWIYLRWPLYLGFRGGSDSKESTCNVWDLDLIPGLGRSHGGWHGNPLQYSLSGESSQTEEPGGLQSMGSQRVGYDWVTKHSTALYLLLWAGIPQKKWSSPHNQQKSPKCSSYVQPQKWQNDLNSFPRKPIQHPSNPTINAEEAEVNQFYEDLQDLPELIPKKMSYSP